MSCVVDIETSIELVPIRFGILNSFVRHDRHFETLYDLA